MKYWKRLSRPGKILTLLLLLGPIILWGIAATPVTPKPKAQISPLVAECSPNASQLLAEINEERSRLGAPVLVIDPALATSAKNKLNDEVANRYYGHNLVDGSPASDFVRAQGVNAAWSEDLDENALNPIEDWRAFKASSTHYASLTDPQYTRVGIAEQCVDFTTVKETDAADNIPIGSHVSELTVVHLAGLEPAQASPQAETKNFYIYRTPPKPLFSNNPY